MGNDELLESARSRFGFGLARDYLKREGVPVSVGWEKTIAKIDAEITEVDAKTELNDSLQAMVDNLALYGEKAVRLYRLPDAEIDLIREAIFGLELVDTKASVKYPALLDDVELRKLTMRPSGCYVSDDSPAIVTTGRHYETERDELRVADFSQAVRDELEGFDNLIGVRRTARQYFDVIAIHRHAPYLELRVSGAKTLSANELEARFKSAKKYAQSLLYELLGNDELVGGFKNFFPSIDNLYEVADGCVKHLGGVTSTASIKDERMRRRQDDLRKEGFHKEGSNAVAAFEKFSITKVWESDTGIGYMSVDIPGTVAVASAEKPVVKTIFITSICEDEYYSTLDRLL